MAEEEAWEYIAHARMQVTEDKYNKAFDLFLVAFDRNPNLIPAHETEFRSILLRLNTILAESNKKDVIFNNFERALRIFPDNSNILNDMGKYLYKFGYYKEAWEHFAKVLKLSPTFANAEKNLNSIKNLLVERWHYRMLNDNIRNESYRQAIHETVYTTEEKVLDIGTGTGLLAIYAHEAYAAKIIGCDSSQLMCNLSDNIIRGNQIRNIKIINKMSKDLNLWDLGGKVSVILTEMFDAGLFGEHVLQMLSHALPAFLNKQGMVIPNAAEFFVQGVQCDHLNKNYQLGSEAKQFLNILSLNVHKITNDEPYDCEDVHLMKDIKYLTKPASVIQINFNDVRDIDETLKRTEPYKVQLTATDSGLMNVVIGWFNLYLSDLITITTNPQAHDKSNAWQQAIFFDDIPTTVQENEIINLEFLMNGGKLTKVPNSDCPITRVSAEIIRFLNDTEYMKLLTNCVSVACVYLGQIAEMSQICVADLCPFPVFGLLMLKRGAKSLMCCATNDCDKEFIIKVFSENQISMSKVTIIYGDDWTPDIFGDAKFHAIFTHALELCGDVNIRLKDISEYLKQSHLLQGGLYMPAQIKLVAQLVSSHWLDLNNRLFDVNVSDYMMANHVNVFSVTQNFEIDFSTLKYVPITEPVILCNYPNAQKYEAKEVPIISDGYANAILCWYSIELLDQFPEITTNRPNSFISGMVFLTFSKEQLVAGKLAKIIQHKDTDGTFKLVMEPL